MRVEFECVVCGRRAAATVDDDAAEAEEPLRTLRDCPGCGFETIWLAA